MPNKYGGNENLEAIEFFKHLNSVVHGQKSRSSDDCGGIHRMAESDRRRRRTADWASACKWNMGWMHDFTGVYEAGSVFPEKCTIIR